MGTAYLIGDLPEALQSVRPLPQHLAALVADGVDDEVAVDVGGVNVCSDQHLAVRPGTGRELLCDVVGGLAVDVLIGTERLGVVVEVHRAVLVIHHPRRQEFLVRKLWF